MQVTIYEYSIKDGKLQKTAHAAVKRTTPRGVVYEFKREQQDISILAHIPPKKKQSMCWI